MFKRMGKAALLGVTIFAGLAALVYGWYTPQWTTPIANETALAVNKTYPFQTNNAHVDVLSFQCVYGSATLASQTFTDGIASTGTLVVSSSPAQGIASTRVCINGTCVISGRDWSWDPAGKSTATATNIMTALNTALSGVVVSTTGANTSTVFSTATLVGTSGNYSMYSSTQAALKIVASPVTTDSSGGATAAMTGGAAAAYAINTKNISIANHNFTTGYGVWFSTQSGVALSPLTPGTTYFVIPVDANTLQLATTSAGAVAGTGIVLTSSRTPTTTDTFKLNASTISGTPTFKWQFSNDGTNWTDTTVGSVGMSAYVNPSTSTVTDFGAFNYAWIRLNVTAPTTGGIRLTCTPNGEGQTNGN